MAAETLLMLRSKNLALTLAPAVGGSIARFDFIPASDGKIEIFRGADGIPATILDAASFPLVPYCNRIRGGVFSFRDRKVTVAQNLQHDPSPLHGEGWLAPWEVASTGEAEAELVFRGGAGEWPWRYEARQKFALDDGGLTVELVCTNLSADAMPCGLGQHPYFSCTGETVVDTHVETVWTVDDKVLPVERVPAAGRFDLRDRRVCGQGLDNGFGGWGGRARIEDPALPFAIELSSPDARFFQLYSPAEGGLFVAEPVTHANAALNAPEESWGELGMRVLEPAETMTLTMRVDVVAAQ